ncbi:hypothetical protein E6O75_ATG11288 [Venturia nashicola]|uniref:Uncharacterized protein n=1 Tax=Venturia nashicola TaxID=86259 RepID=A0A4Z1ND34_9PEZI|nr:hypothetical protein E6O75_ATG11288 [Venturia nashicola]
MKKFDVMNRRQADRDKDIWCMGAAAMWVRTQGRQQARHGVSPFVFSHVYQGQSTSMSRLQSTPYRRDIWKCHPPLPTHSIVHAFGTGAGLSKADQSLQSQTQF